MFYVHSSPEMMAVASLWANPSSNPLPSLAELLRHTSLKHIVELETLLNNAGTGWRSGGGY